MHFRLGELFCGPGGLALGAVKADIGDREWSIKHQWATDFDADTCETYRSNLVPDTPETVVHEDIRELDYQRLHDLGDIDGLAFGFPCNDFSIVGRNKGLNGKFGPLYTYGAKALQDFRPQWFLAENVGGLRSANRGEAFNLIERTFRECGYRLVTHLYRFERYGVPQARHRVIIIGIREDLPYEYRVPSTELYKDLDVSARAAITKPPIPQIATGNELTRQSETVIERLSHIKPGQNVFTAEMPERLKLNVRGVKISQIYKRLDPARPAYTVTGSGGGGTHMYHWEMPRALTNRERARLQTFPDSFNFTGSKESVRKQIGMAVPVLGAKVIFEAVLRTFKGEDYPSEQATIH